MLIFALNVIKKLCDLVGGRGLLLKDQIRSQGGGREVKMGTHTHTHANTHTPTHTHTHTHIYTHAYTNIHIHRVLQF